MINTDEILHEVHKRIAEGDKDKQYRWAVFDQILSIIKKFDNRIEVREINETYYSVVINRDQLFAEIVLADWNLTLRNGINSENEVLMQSQEQEESAKEWLIKLLIRIKEKLQ